MKSFLLTLFMLSLTSISIAQEWTQVSSLPTAFQQTHHSFAFSIDNQGYMVGGFNDVGALKDFYTYDADADEWTQLPDYDGPARGYGIGEVFDGKAYFGFGYDGNTSLKDLWVFDPTDDSWTQLASCPCTARYHPAMVILDGIIYVGLGGSSNGNLRDWWAYSIENNNWTPIPLFPGVSRHHPYQFAANGHVYAGLGHGDNGIYKDFYKYDPVANAWTEVAEMPDQGRVAGTQFSYNGKGYVLSGEGEDHRSFTTGEFWEYDPEADEWLELDAHPGRSRWAPASFVINGEVYIINGMIRTQNTQSYVSTVFKYTLEEPSSTTTIELDAATVYPNPFTSSITLELEETEIDTDNFDLKIYNSLGQIVYTSSTYENTINLETLSKGVFSLTITNGEKVYSKSIVKQ